jgi:hypothetical protein
MAAQASGAAWCPAAPGRRRVGRHRLSGQGLLLARPGSNAAIAQASAVPPGASAALGAAMRQTATKPGQE